MMWRGDDCKPFWSRVEIVGIAVDTLSTLGHSSPIIPPHLELYTDSVFSVGIRSVFLGIYHTDTEGKLGRYISV